MHRQREWKHSDPPVCSPKRFPSQQPSGPSALLMSRSCSNWTQAAFCAGSGSGSTGSSFTRTGWQVEKPIRCWLVAPLPARIVRRTGSVLRTRVPSLPYARLHRCVMRAPLKARFPMKDSGNGDWKAFGCGGLIGVKSSRRQSRRPHPLVGDVSGRRCSDLCRSDTAARKRASADARSARAGSA